MNSFSYKSETISLDGARERDGARKEVSLISLWRAFSTYGCLERASQHKLLRALVWKNNHSLIFFCHFFQIAVVRSIKQLYIHVNMLNKLKMAQI